MDGGDEEDEGGWSVGGMVKMSRDRLFKLIWAYPQQVT